jgi:hypothetical protein
MEHLSVSSLLGNFLALLTNIRQRWKSLLGTNNLAYYKTFLNYGRKKFYKIRTQTWSINLLVKFIIDKEYNQ